MHMSAVPGQEPIKGGGSLREEVREKFEVMESILRLLLLRSALEWYSGTERLATTAMANELEWEANREKKEK